MCHIMSNRNISQLICNGSGNLLLGACQWSNGQQPFIKKNDSNCNHRTLYSKIVALLGVDFNQKSDRRKKYSGFLIHLECKHCL